MRLKNREEKLFLFFKTFEAVLIFIGLGVVGFWLIAKRSIPKEALTTLSFLAIEISVPALVLFDMLTKFEPLGMSYWWHFPLFWWASFLFLWLISKLFSFLFPKEFREEAKVSLLYPNAIFIPLILLPSIFPEVEDIEVKLFLFTMFFPFVLFNIFGFFYKNSKGKFNFSLSKTFHPIVSFTIFAIIIKYLNWSNFIPSFFIDIIKRLGVLAIPLLVFVIGGNFYLERKAILGFPKKYIALFVLIKNIFFQNGKNP